MGRGPLCRSLSYAAMGYPEMSAVDEIDKLGGIVPVTPEAVAELITEIKRMRAVGIAFAADALARTERIGDGLREMQDTLDPTCSAPSEMEMDHYSHIERLRRGGNHMFFIGWMAALMCVAGISMVRETWF